MEEDLRMAREIQQAMIPQQYPSFPKNAPAEANLLRFCHRYIPNGAVGGDFFYITPLSDTKAGVFICDVMGHGVRSALVTAILRALVEELTRHATTPGELLEQINRDLRAILRQSGAPMFTTAFYMMVDLEERRIYYSNAGHPKPLLVHRQSGTVESLNNHAGPSSPALGLFDDTRYPNSDCRISNEDLLVLFTDGVYDMEHDGDFLSPEWLKQELQKRSQKHVNCIFDEILEVLKSYSENEEFVDDVCLVGLEFPAPPSRVNLLPGHL